MKILIVTFHSLWGMDEYVSNTLSAMGHSVQSFYTNCGGGPAEKIYNKAHYYKFLDKPLGRLWEKKINERLLATVFKIRPDLVFIIKGDEIFPESLHQIKKLYNPIIINWFTDNPFYLGLNNIIEAIPIYDHIFTFDCGHIPLLKEHSAKQVSFLPLSCQPGIHRRLSLSEQEIRQYGSDVCFVGTVEPVRINIIRQLLDYDIAVWGKGWKRELSWLKGHYRGEASGEKMVKIYNASKIALNIHHPQTIEGANLRTFEICGCGALQLVDERSCLAQLFECGREILSFKDVKELRKHLDYFLSHEQERIVIADNGYRKVIGEHTYEHRIKRIFELLWQKK